MSDIYNVHRIRDGQFAWHLVFLCFYINIPTYNLLVITIIENHFSNIDLDALRNRMKIIIHLKFK